MELKQVAPFKYDGAGMDYPVKNEIEVMISDDERKAYMTVSAENQKKNNGLTSSFLLETLCSRGVVKGIDEKILTEIAADKLSDNKVLVAEAIPPKVGNPATITIEVKPKERSTYDRGVDAERRVDHYGVREGFIIYVQAGQVIATYNPPAKGEPGFTVTGKTIDGLVGQDLTLSEYQGKNTKIVGDRLIAETEGILANENGKFEVRRDIVVEGDIGIKTGSIILPLEADINLTIGGDIKTGFKVQCRNVQVHGSVEDATVTAKFLNVQKGIVGTSKKPVSANIVTAGYIAGTRHIKAKYLHVAKEISGGSKIEADFVYSSVIQGSSVTARYGVWSEYLYGGSQVWVGVNIEESAEYSEWSARLADIEKTIIDLREKSLQFLRKEDSVREMASRMPNNPAIQKEWMKIIEAKENLAKGEKARLALEQKMREHMDKMFFDGSAFILVRMGFARPADKKAGLKSVNELRIRDFAYDKSNPLTPGMYVLKGNTV